MTQQLITIERFILDRQPAGASGDFTALLYDIGLAAKMVAMQTRRAGLLDVLGYANNVNVQGEAQRKLDVYADDVFYRLNSRTGRVCAMASEERDEWIPVPAGAAKGQYVLVYDPLDGSSNIDANISIGTIFGIYRTLDDDNRGRLEDCLQPGSALVAAGYILYSTSTMLVYSAGDGVHGFTLDPELGEFLLSFENLRYPEPAAYYSVNYGAYPNWSVGTQAYVNWLHANAEPRLSQRYIGSLVADFHRNLMSGGVYAYPAEADRPQGKIRLLYEAAPLAFLAEQAGGYGSDGRRSLLDIVPGDIHQRTPVYVGNRDLVEAAEQFIAPRRP